MVQRVPHFQGCSRHPENTLGLWFRSLCRGQVWRPQLDQTVGVPAVLPSLHSCLDRMYVWRVGASRVAVEGM